MFQEDIRRLSKVTAYDYYKTLERLTDNTGLGPHFERFRPWLRMVRQWRHLIMLKRAGRGHYEDGINTTGKGELAVKCPACPDPEVNLPDNWDTISDDLKFIYTIILAIDANFRLRRRAVSNDARDPSLGSGWGYFVENEAYREFLRQHVSQDEMSTCTGFSALLSANTKFTRGYATSGVAMAVDARHGFVLGNGVGDLQKGERYCNVDYICGAAWNLLPQAVRHVLSYDIACQWSVNHASRILELPEHIRFEIPTGGQELRYAIPKWHWRAHKEEKHEQYSLYLLPGVGRTDGEEIERNWSRNNMVAYSTREMGPGSRHDTLEDHFGYANWQKLVLLGATIKRKLKENSIEKVAQDRVYDDFLGQLHEDHVRQWIEQVVEWEHNTSLPSPYYVPPHGVSEAEVRAQLTEEDEELDGILQDEDENGDEDDDSANHVSTQAERNTPSSIMIALFDMEETQRKFRMKFPRQANGQPLRTADVIEKRRALSRRIVNLRVTQAIYMPIVPQLVDRHRRGQDDVLPEEQKLLFPSQLTCDELDGCTPGIAEIEERLREGQLHDSLNKIRVHLHIKSRLMIFKNRNVRNQAANTRASTKIAKNERKIREYAQKYRIAREAKLSISGPGNWERAWRVLQDADIKTMKGELDDAPIPGENCTRLPEPLHVRPGESEGRRKTSWIWAAADASDGDPDMGMVDALRVEFLRARARCHRFAEEISMLKEEQRRTLVSFEKEALKWDSRMLAAHEVDLAVREGLAAYAEEHSAMYRGLAQSFGELWKLPITELALYTLDEGMEDQEVVPAEGSSSEAKDEDEEPGEDFNFDAESDNDSLGLNSDNDDNDGDF